MTVIVTTNQIIQQEIMGYVNIWFVEDIISSVVFNYEPLIIMLVYETITPIQLGYSYNPVFDQLRHWHSFFNSVEPNHRHDVLSKLLTNPRLPLAPY